MKELKKRHKLKENKFDEKTKLFYIHDLLLIIIIILIILIIIIIIVK